MALSTTRTVALALMATWLAPLSPSAGPGGLLAQDATESDRTREYPFQRNAEMEAFRVLEGRWDISANGLTCSSKGAADEIQIREQFSGMVEVSLTVESSRACELRLRSGAHLWRVALAKADGEVVLWEADEERARVEVAAAKGRQATTLVVRASSTGVAVKNASGDWSGVTARGEGAATDAPFQISLASIRSQSTFAHLALRASRVDVDPRAGQPEPEQAADADALLALAEDHARRGRYGAAVSAYRALAANHAGTEAGAIGARRARPSAFLGWDDVVRHGPSENRVDVVLMGEGYTLEHQDAFVRLAADIPPLFEKQDTFREYYGYFNFLRAILVSRDAGVDEFDREYDTALGGRRTGSIQGHVAVDHGQVMQMLDELPSHDRLAIVFVRRGLLGTGGRGVATIGGRDNETVIHEFGHAFGGLGDEYTQQTVHRGETATRPNVSATDDPERVPWRHWLEARVRGVGIYEGADGRVKDAWKPTTRSCVMDNGKFFCPVCREALVLAIYQSVDPIEGCEPEPGAFESPDAILVEDERTFRVDVMLPATHGLEVTWYVVPEQQAPPGIAGWEKGAPGSDRRGRGPLPRLDVEPAEQIQHRRQPRHEFTVRSRDLEVGRYRVICRVRDDTRMRGDPTPWVIADPAELLISERAWWIEVAAR